MEPGTAKVETLPAVLETHQALQEVQRTERNELITFASLAFLLIVLFVVGAAFGARLPVPALDSYSQSR